MNLPDIQSHADEDLRQLATMTDPNLEFIRKLDELYMELHLAGIAKVNFEPRKVIIDDDGKLTLVDMSTCVVNTEAGILQLAQELRTDSGFITRLEKQSGRVIA